MKNNIQLLENLLADEQFIYDFSTKLIYHLTCTDGMIGATFLRSAPISFERKTTTLVLVLGDFKLRYT
jgi:hypothetical protein